MLGFAALIALALLCPTNAQESRLNPSLRSFQVASAESTISNACLQVYNSPIVGCTDTEFLNSACSAGCVRGVESIQQDIQDACDDVRTDTRTLLGQALLGNLVEVLCESGRTSPPAPAPRPGTTTVSVPTPPAAGRGGDSNSTPLNFLPSSTASGRAPVNTNDPVGVVPPSAQPTKDADANDDKDGNGDSSERQNGVGGSPFDIVAQDNAGITSPILADAILMAAGVAVLLLR